MTCSRRRIRTTSTSCSPDRIRSGRRIKRRARERPAFFAYFIDRPTFNTILPATGAKMENHPDVFTIPALGDTYSLPAQRLLAGIDEARCFHRRLSVRHPFGIYNLSVARICRNLTKLSDLLSAFWSTLPINKPSDDDIIDRLELCLYSAAEHVDDIELIAKTFFIKDQIFAKSPNVRKLKSEIKPLRDDISKIVNTIKHVHGRIRLLEFSFSHSNKNINLIGFFVEGYKDGVLGPHPILHSQGSQAISITAMMWRIISYVGEISNVLSRFIVSIEAGKEKDITDKQNPFQGCIHALTLLPAYSIDDDYPLELNHWTIKTSFDGKPPHGTIYGSMYEPWDESDEWSIGQFKLGYRGDGITNSFKIVNIANLKIQRWKKQQIS